MLVKIHKVSIIVVLLRVCFTDNFLFLILDFLCISKVSSMLHHGSMGRVHSRPQSCTAKKSEQSKLKKPATSEKFFTIT